VSQVLADILVRGSYDVGHVNAEFADQTRGWRALPTRNCGSSPIGPLGSPRPRRPTSIWRTCSSTPRSSAAGPVWRASSRRFGHDPHRRKVR
jgi:hypothetical protein